MNHIRKMQLLNRVRKEQVEAIRSYLHSSKFSSNPMVNRGDIFLRLDEYEQAINEVESGNVPQYLENEYDEDGDPRQDFEVEAIKRIKNRFAQDGVVMTAKEATETASYLYICSTIDVQ